ncbi:hypothetical protein H7K45_01420 [Mycobacterium yunnanensis]|uniref:Transmembrane protein n=1 Tax=Mycobacterium yunnanensis TaxID=368477 RepID=A0A9X2YVK5_9MYCO|nr:hypothetical protein [Mycobacterium yunnanensis]MCV7419189.1 hypothetical protein [Mycobacterium yunnanensis]
MARLRPGWFVVLCAAVLLVSAWLPWLVTSADGGGRANAIGGKLGAIGVPPNGFGVGQLIVVLSSVLAVAAAMSARRLRPKLASTAALGISVVLAVLVVWYYRLYVGNPIVAGYGLYVGAGAVVAAAVLSVFAMVTAWAEMGSGR